MATVSIIGDQRVSRRAEANAIIRCSCRRAFLWRSSVVTLFTRTAS